MSHVSQRTSHVTPFRRLARLGPLPLFLAALAPATASAATGGDHLVVTVRDAGEKSATYEVSCPPDRDSQGVRHSTHPDLPGACAALERNTRWGRDTFAPVPEGSVCTMLYGGPATAHVTGTWAGRPVDARFDRSNGCETARWDRFVPLLPDMGPHSDA
ncbi:SSI family serine proteinase inhibitor [Streptomyces sp. 351MFTsu5.1]|uniref:SSI family serine proteinase inhibitor n=1 Tax=Streptomyces sp. 351MFTsu5.1 TaxID=1172180 RepID=UPI000368BBAC|nr:SSI family serine proteinase inhibitor [Streptomyces sp. 351MFTsu5.1]